MRLFLSIGSLALWSAAFSQPVINVENSDAMPQNAFFMANSTPFVNTRFVRLAAGTPYFTDVWMKGVAISGKDLRFAGSQVRLDLFDNQLHFLTPYGEDHVFAMPLKSLTLTDTINGATYQFVHAAYEPLLASAKQGWYLQLVKGEASLFQYFKKVVSESRPFNSPVTEQKIITTEEYVVAVKGSLLKAKKPKDIPALLETKKEALEAFLKNNETKNSSTARLMAAVVAHYNSLQ